MPLNPQAARAQATHECPCFGLPLHALDEATIDLDLLDLEIAQMVEARMTRAEII
jgi:hypothetical protein